MAELKRTTVFIMSCHLTLFCLCVSLCVSVYYYFVLRFYFNDFSYHVAITYGPF